MLRNFIFWDSTIIISSILETFLLEFHRIDWQYPNTLATKVSWIILPSIVNRERKYGPLWNFLKQPCLFSPTERVRSSFKSFPAHRRLSQHRLLTLLGLFKAPVSLCYLIRGMLAQLQKYDIHNGETNSSMFIIEWPKAFKLAILISLLVLIWRNTKAEMYLKRTFFVFFNILP